MDATHRRATMPSAHTTLPLARGHLRTALAEPRLMRNRVVAEAHRLVNREVSMVHLRLLYGLLWHREEEVMLLGKYLLATNQVDVAVVLLEAWSRNPHRQAVAA